MMNNVFIFTGNTIETVNLLEDHYLQLILIQYSIKSVSFEKEELERKLDSKQNIISSSLKYQWLEELKTLRTLETFLSEWLQQLNRVCPNPETSPNHTSKRSTH